MNSKHDDTEQARAPMSPRLRGLIRGVDEIIVRVSKHWLGIGIVGLFLFQALPWLAPVLMHAGYTRAAEWIYAVYAPLCHQLAYRSFFLFGAQPAYALTELQTHLETDRAASDGLFWRAFLGDATTGYKLAYCERDAAIYTTAWLCLVAYALLRRTAWFRPLPLRWFLAVFVSPIAVDGFTQLFGWRESDALLRVLTGFWFAVGASWFVLPLIDEALRDLYAQTMHQLERIHARDAATRAS